MPQGSEAGLASDRVPDQGGVVVASRQHPAAVGAERHVGDGSVVEPELAQAGALAQDGGDASAVRLVASLVLLQLQGPREPDQGAEQVLVLEVMRSIGDVEPDQG